MLIVDGSKIVGAVFVGPPGVGKSIETIIQSNPDVTPVIADLRRGNWEALSRLTHPNGRGREEDGTGPSPRGSDSQQPREAEGLYKRALAIREQARGANHADVGQTLTRTS